MGTPTEVEYPRIAVAVPIKDRQASSDDIIPLFCFKGVKDYYHLIERQDFDYLDHLDYPVIHLYFTLH